MQKRQTKRTLPLTAMGVLAIASLILTAAQCDDGDDPVVGAPDDNAVLGDAEQATQEESDRQRDGKRARHDGHHRRDHRRHGSEGFFLGTALAKLDLTDEQRATLEDLKGEGSRHHKDGKHARGKGQHKGDRGDFHKAIITALETGTVDRAAMEKEPARDGDRFAEFKEKRAARLNTLHATLTPEQRTQLAQLVRAQMEKKGESGKYRGKHRKGGHPMFAGMLSDLDLSEEQQTKLEALKESIGENRPSDEDRSARHEKMRAHLTEVLDAFTKTDFDAATLQPVAPTKERFGKRSEVKAEMLEGIIEILTEEQRLELAETLKDRGPGHDGRRGRGKGKGHGRGMGHGR